LKNISTTIFIILFHSFLFAQSNYSLKGKIIDKATNDPLPGVSIIVNKNIISAITDKNGEFLINNLTSNEYVVTVKLFGFSEQTQKVNVTNNTTINFSLSTIELKEVEISDSKKQNTESSQLSSITLTMDKIKTLPAFMGEVDVLKTLQLLPGVQSAGEGNSGFYVRGGGPDQNLILMDEAIVFNPSHLFGFFSIFNSDAIEKVELTKGGMPASYGGRLASVIDITQKTGDKDTFRVEGGIGLIASRLTLQGPIKKKKSSFIVSGRRTYIDILAKPFIPKKSGFEGSSYFFYDFNTKLNIELSPKDALSFSGYYGKDVFNFNSNQSEFKTNVNWGNAIANLGWKHRFNENLFSQTNAYFSDYNFAFTGIQDDFTIKLLSGIKSYNLKSNLSFYPNANHALKAGFHATRHIFTPNNASASQGETIFNLGEKPKFVANELAIYLQDEFEIGTKIKINTGVRFSIFNHIGPFTRYIVDENGNKKDTINYKKNDNIKMYNGLEPRFSMRYKLKNSFSLKAAFTQNYQYVHQATISPLALPTDIWMPSTSIVKPQFATQYNAGIFKNFKDDSFETSIELYYKQMNNLIEYKENTSPEEGVNNNEDNLLTFGKGNSYGTEFLIRKNIGKINGWIGYTWSKTQRQFEEINNNQIYPATYDRRNDLSIVFSYQLNKKWNFGSTFVYASGNAISLPISWYFIENRLALEYSERNSFRMASYHRLDISATRKGKEFIEKKNIESGEIILKKKKFNSSWTFSIFNLYSRQNPYFYYFDNQGNVAEGNFKLTAKQVSLFPILPSITWNFNF
jgi:CarboxypepD_reg-like domain/TonB-dependent Receptor Plug Domain